MSETNDNKAILIGGPANVAPGSVKHACATCGRDAWIAFSGQRFLREHPDATVLCAACGLAMWAKDDATTEVRLPTREQLLEDLGITGRN